MSKKRPDRLKAPGSPERTERIESEADSSWTGTDAPASLEPADAGPEASALRQELIAVRQRLQEAEEILRAIKNDEIDALAISNLGGGSQIYTLEGAEHPYRLLVETINEGAMTLSADGKLLYCNPALAKLLGKRPDQLVGTPMRDFVKPTDVQLFQALLDRGIKGRSKDELELIVDDQAVPVLLSFSALDIKDVPCSCVIVTDLREQKRNEEILASERLTNSILEQAAEAIVVCDEGARIIRANQQARSLCNCNPLLNSFDEVFPLYSVPAPAADAALPEPTPWSVLSVLSGQSYGRHEVVFKQSQDGQVRHLLVSASSLSSSEGLVIGCVVSLFDITQRKQIEQAQAELLVREQQARADAQAANKSKDIFLATLSHELRTPLNAIFGWVRLLRSPPNAKIAQKAIEVIDRNARMQAQLIDDVLDISRIISGKIALEPNPLNLFPVIGAAIESVRLAAEAKGIKISAAMNSDSDLVIGDAARLQQVFWNLLSNATKFTPSGGSIEINLTTEGKNLCVRVTDTGQGIDKDFLPFVFDRFRQEDGSHSRQHGGLGLGLAIVRHLVEMHGGAVTVASLGRDQGSTFTVQIPRSARPMLRPEEQLTGERTQGNGLAGKLLSGLHLLVVDDQADTLDVLALALEQQGAVISTASSADEALKFLEAPSAGVDVLISDIAMPGGDGYYLIHTLRTREAGGKQRPEIPAIALTAFASAADAEDALQAGFQKHIRKPVDLGELTTTIAQLSHKRTQSATQ